MSVLSLLASLFQVAILVINHFMKQPQEAQSAFLTDLNNAVKKAKDEKDPKDLSNLINKL